MMDQNMERATSMVLAMMSSASSDNIKRFDWWERAKTSLETAAACATDFSEMVSIMGRKLQIEAATSATAETIYCLTAELGENFEPFRRLCETQALYVVALAQAKRDLEKSARKQQKDLEFETEAS